MSVYFTTNNKDLSGRSSNFHREKKNAQTKCDGQNAKAESLGLKSRYTVEEFDGAVDPKEVRD